MTYLLSLLKSNSSSTEKLLLEQELDSLCYYMNNTSFVQNIRVIAKRKCIFECLVFPKERILFKASSNACIQVSTFLLDRTKTTELKCQQFRIAEKCDS